MLSRLNMAISRQRQTRARGFVTGRQDKSARSSGDPSSREFVEAWQCLT
jgi:hypothetical protein